MLSRLALLAAALATPITLPTPTHAGVARGRPYSAHSLCPDLHRGAFAAHTAAGSDPGISGGLWGQHYSSVAQFWKRYAAATGAHLAGYGRLAYTGGR
jgi:hypothetical protein